MPTSSRDARARVSRFRVPSRDASAMASDGEEVGCSGSEGEERVHATETRGQMLQRHKREQKACKDAVKRMGKKRKEEATKMEEDLKKRQEKERTAFVSLAEFTDEQFMADYELLEGVRVGTESAKRARPPIPQRNLPPHLHQLKVQAKKRDVELLLQQPGMKT
eukprot:jgi/Pico_ML_1/53107/g3716.t1